MHRRCALFFLLLSVPWLPEAGACCGTLPADEKAPDAAGELRVAAPPSVRSLVESLSKGVFLIASERMRDPNFAQSVILLLEYDATGALGLIINRPSNVALASALPDVEGLGSRSDTLYLGGPVGRNQLFLLVRSSSRPEGAKPVVGDVYSSVNLETLRALLADDDAQFHAHAGYAGWGPAQLDGEVMRGDWYVTQADAVTIFEQASDEIWPTLMKKNAGLWVDRRLLGRPLARTVRARLEALYGRLLARNGSGDPGAAN